MSEYPKKIYKSVLLLNGKIINWKIADYGWKTTEDALSGNQILGLILNDDGSIRDGLTVDCVSEIQYNHVDNRRIFRNHDFFMKYRLNKRAFKTFMSPYDLEDYELCRL